MTNTYDTSALPLGTTSVKALYNNSSNFDEGMNSSSPSFVDRLGKRRETWAGMETSFSDFLVNSGFESVHLTYVVGTPLNVLRPTQLIDYNGSIYRVKMPANFPVALTGVWATDAQKLVDVGDASLRQSLAGANGDALIGVAPAVVTMITRTQQERNRDDISAAWFGVKSGTADMSAPIKLARDYFQSIGGGTINMPWGDFYAADIEIPRGVNFRGKGKLATRMRPSADGISQILRITGGLADVGGLAFMNDSGYAVDAILINKAVSEDNLPTTIEDIYASQFRAFNRISAGNCIHHDKLTLNSNTESVYYAQDGRNGSMQRCYILGGNGPSFFKGSQGCEGYQMFNNHVLQASGAYGLLIQQAHDFKIFGNVFDQVITGQAIILDASVAGNSIFGVKMWGNYLGRQLGAAGANYGLYVVGNVQKVESAGDTYVGFTDSAIKLLGTLAQPLSEITIERPGFYQADRNVVDISLQYCQRTYINNAGHSGVASIVEGPGCDGRVENGTYGSSALPARVTNGLRYGKQVEGMTMRSTGSSVVPTGTRTVTINHGLSYRPLPHQIRVQPNMTPNNAYGGLVVTVPANDTQFVVTCQTDPGASNLGIDWVADISE